MSCFDSAACSGIRGYFVRFSIIIPVFEQWHYIPQLIDCLAAQSIGSENFEVILVDNGTPGFIEPVLEYSGRMKIVTCSVPGSYAARNLGVAHSEGEWLAFTDADCLPAQNWLESITAEISKFNTQDLLLAGGVEVYQKSSSPGPYEIYDIVKGIPQGGYVENGYAATANLIVSRSLIDSLGGFNPALYSGGDKDFCRRAVGVGAVLSYLHDAKVLHRARVSWEDIANKARRLKGGQIGSASGKNLYFVIVRTFVPPIFAVIRFLRIKDKSLYFKFIAILVQFRVWIVEMTELIRLVRFGGPERR